MSRWSVGWWRTCLWFRCWWSVVGGRWVGGESVGESMVGGRWLVACQWYVVLQYAKSFPTSHKTFTITFYRIRQISFSVLEYTQPAFTWSKATIETLEKMWEICSKLTIKTLSWLYLFNILVNLRELEFLPWPLIKYHKRKLFIGHEHMLFCTFYFNQNYVFTV